MSCDSVQCVQWKRISSGGNISKNAVITVSANIVQTNNKAEADSIRFTSTWNLKFPPKWKWWLGGFPLSALAIWSLSYSVFANQALPGGSVFALAVLELLAIVLGHAAQHFHLPPAFGMLSAGLLLRNLPFINIGDDLDPAMTNPIRAMSVVVLLTRGALAVSPALISKHKLVILPLCIGSCLCEACAASISAYFLLGFPVQWCTAIGCIFSAMSGAIVMPFLVDIEQQGLGPEHYVMSIAKQGSGLDAILAIAMTELSFGFIFADGDLFNGIQKGAMEVVFGIVFGVAWGSAVGFCLGEDAGTPLKTFVVFAGGSTSLLGLTTIGRPRGGPVGCFFGSLVVACVWRSRSSNSATEVEEVSQNMTSFWYFFQPMLFGIIGSRVDIATVNWDVVITAGTCLVISLSARMIATFAMLSFGGGMTTREKLFVVVAWLPKGTVQAALGPVVMETAQSIGFDAETLPYDLITISVMVIVFGTLIGPITLQHFGPKLLRYNQ